MTGESHLSRPRLDEETLAAFMDGRLSPLERERVLRHLVQSPDDRELLTQAAASLGDVAGDRGPAVVARVPKGNDALPRLVPRNRRLVSSGLAAAVAAVAAVAVATFVALPLARRSPEVASNIPSLVSWYDGASRIDDASLTAPWPGTRGSFAALAPHVRDFRLGVRALDFTLAAKADDSAGVRRFARELVSLVVMLPGGGLSATELERVEQGGAVDRERLPVLADRLRRQVETPFWYDLGAIAEARRVVSSLGHPPSSAAALRVDEAFAALMARTDPALLPSARERAAFGALARANAANGGDPARIGRSRVYAAQPGAGSILDSLLREGAH